MRKFVTISLFLVSFLNHAQIKPISLGAGIGNQYAMFGGARLAILLSNRLEPSISYGYAGWSTEITAGLTYYFKPYYPTNYVDLYDKTFDWPSGITLGFNYYQLLKNQPIKEDGWEKKELGMTLLFFYKLKPKSLFNMTNTPVFERRFGFGATYIFTEPPFQKIFVIPSLMYGVDLRLPVKFKGYLF
jgi:hypothetical protein